MLAVRGAPGLCPGCVFPARVSEKKVLKKMRKDLQVSKISFNFASFFAPPRKIGAGPGKEDIEKFTIDKVE